MKYEDFKQKVEHMGECQFSDMLEHYEAVERFDYESIRPRIFYRVESTLDYSKRWKDAVTIPFFDMLITFRWLFQENDEGIASALIEQGHLDSWNVTEEEIVEAAIRNTPWIFPFCSKKLIDIIRPCIDFDDPDFPIQVITNSIGMHGATVCLYHNALKSQADRIQDDLYILPSSIHELLLVPKKDASSVKDLYDMVWEANHTVVDSEEFLSNQVYYYDRKKNEIELVPK